MKEIELKLLVERGLCDAIWDRCRKAGLLAEEPAEHHVISTYLDTAGFDLRKQGISLRLRRQGDAWVQTVKADRQIHGGLSSALELEAEAQAGTFDIARVADEAVRDRIMHAVNGSRLETVFETDMTRTSAVVRTEAGDEALLCTDEGQIRTASDTSEISEVEIELVDGRPGALFDIARTLLPDGSKGVSSVSKAERGYLLAETGQAGPRPEIRKSLEIVLDADLPVHAAALRVFRECLAQISANIDASEILEDPEGPHQLRVGLRRLRVALSVFGAVVGPEEAARLGEEARWLAGEAGRIRDIDVLAGEMVAREAACHPAEAGLVLLEETLKESALMARSVFRQALASPRTARFRLDLAGFIEGIAFRPPTGESQADREVSIVDLAGRQLGRRWKRIRRRARHIETLDTAERHELRKSLKKFRYAVEFFASLFPARRVRPFISRLRRLQLDFGAMNDAAMAQAILSGMDDRFTVEPRLERPVGWVLGAAETRAAIALERAGADWERLARAKPFWT